MFEDDNDSLDPLAILETLLQGIPSSGVQTAIDACRKVVRAYAKVSRDTGVTSDEADEQFRLIVSRVQPNLSDDKREELLRTLGHTFRVWVR